MKVNTQELYRGVWDVELVVNDTELSDEDVVLLKRIYKERRKMYITLREEVGESKLTICMA